MTPGRIPYETIELPPADNPLGHLGQMMDAAIGAACEFYREDPSAAVGREFNAPGVAALDALYRRMCDRRPEGPLPAPSLPFPGGQCDQNYNVTFSYTVPGTLLNGSITTVQVGPISGVTSEAGDLGSTWWGFRSKNGFHRMINNPKGQEISPNISVAPVGGGPDNCGNPSPQLPGPFVGGKEPVLVRPPIALPPAPGLPPVPIAPVIIPVGPITVVPTFSPEINVNLGPFNFNFNFGGGAPVSLPPGGGLPPTLPPGGGTTGPNLPPSLPPSSDSPEVSLSCPPPNLVPILEAIEELDEQQKFYRDTLIECLGSGGTLTFQVLGEGEGGSVVVPKDSLYILIAAKEPLPDTKSQREIKNPVGQPNVYFGGWCQFQVGDDFNMPREPISSDKCAYTVPRNAAVQPEIKFSWSTTLSVSYSVGVVRRIPLSFPYQERPCLP